MEIAELMIEYENLIKTNEPFQAEYEAAFQHFLKNGWFILGNGVKKFEEEYADYCGTRLAIGVANGLQALVLSLNALELPPQSEIIVPSNTYIASILAIVLADLLPVLVEPDIRTYNLDPSLLAPALTHRTKGIMAVHLYGKLCCMDSIMAFAENHGLKVIEDCAQAHGASYNGQRAGSWGHINAHSFYPTKNLGALGDAGCVTCNDTDLADRVRTLRNYGSKVKYYNEIVGTNSRLDELQALFLGIKLKSINKINEHKRRLAKIYSINIGSKYIKPITDNGFYDVYHIYNIRHPQRDRLREYLFAKGVKTEIHYPVPPHRQRAMRGIIYGNYPISEEIHKTTLSLPISFSHTEEDVFTVCQILRDFQ